MYLDTIYYIIYIPNLEYINTFNRRFNLFNENLNFYIYLSTYMVLNI